MRQRLRNLREESSGEDVGEVGDLERRASVKEATVVKLGCKQTCSFFFVSSTLASASLASTPRVFPRNLTSSTSSFSFSDLMCGSMSAAESSFKPFPSSEKTLGSGILSKKKEQAPFAGQTKIYKTEVGREKERSVVCGVCASMKELCVDCLRWWGFFGGQTDPCRCRCTVADESASGDAKTDDMGSES